MNIRILQDVENYKQRGEVAQIFAQKWADQLTGIFCVLFPESLTLNIPLDDKDRDQLISKCGHIFGLGGWNRATNSRNWFKVVDGVTVTLVNAEPSAIDVLNVPVLAFSLGAVAA